jgi:hypothetical protein
MGSGHGIKLLHIQPGKLAQNTHITEILDCYVCTRSGV